MARKATRLREAIAPPANIQAFFPELRWEDSLADQYPFHVAERLLERGNSGAVNWVRARYGDEMIQDVLKRSRNISRRIAGYWQIVLDIPQEEIRCLSESSTDQPKKSWNS